MHLLGFTLPSETRHRVLLRVPGNPAKSRVRSRHTVDKNGINGKHGKQKGIKNGKKWHQKMASEK